MFWVATAPTPARTCGQRDPTEIEDVTVLISDDGPQMRLHCGIVKKAAHLRELDGQAGHRDGARLVAAGLQRRHRDRDVEGHVEGHAEGDAR